MLAFQPRPGSGTRKRAEQPPARHADPRPDPRRARVSRSGRRARSASSSRRAPAGGCSRSSGGRVPRRRGLRLFGGRFPPLLVLVRLGRVPGLTGTSRQGGARRGVRGSGVRGLPSLAQQRSRLGSLCTPAGGDRGARPAGWRSSCSRPRPTAGGHSCWPGPAERPYDGGDEAHRRLRHRLRRWHRRRRLRAPRQRSALPPRLALSRSRAELVAALGAWLVRATPLPSARARSCGERLVSAVRWPHRLRSRCNGHSFARTEPTRISPRRRRASRTRRARGQARRNQRALAVRRRIRCRC